MVTSLIQMFTKWQHLHLGTEPKTVVSSQIQLLGKQHHRHLGTVTNIKHCHIITDTVIRKRSTSTFRNIAQDVDEQFKCSQKTAKM